MTNAEKVSDLLNHLFQIDPLATSRLVAHRAEFSESLMNSHERFVCSKKSDGVITMGVIGVMNAVIDPASGRIASVYDENGVLTGFTVITD
ncbi:hypothetical protein AACK17_00655 [Pectobacterium punjabense]|uniref:hypothetical protein n=1 Tax=Pectobacterium punjabense TaxID=2108399 RepID=UPI00311F645E